MRRATPIVTALLSTLFLVGCGGGSGATATTAPAASQPAASEEPAASDAAPAAEACSPSSDAGAVSVEIAGFAYEPAEATAKVGEVITWTNTDAAPHTATLDEGDCATGNLPADGSGGLVFSVAGTYPYHCAIHPTMTGSVTVTE